MFEARRRGSDEGPAYHAIFTGQNFGGHGTYNVGVRCRQGPARVTVHNNGMDGRYSPPPYPFSLNISVEDERFVFRGVVADGQVIRFPVRARLRVMTGGINESPFRIEYECDGT